MGLRLGKSLIFRSMAVFVLLGGGLISWSAWKAIHENHATYLEKVINVEGNLIAGAVESDLSVKYNALAFLSERYHASSREMLLGSIDDWAEFLTTAPGVLTVAIADPDGQVLWNYHKSTGVVLTDIIQRLDWNITSSQSGRYVRLPDNGNASINQQFLVLWALVYDEQQQTRRLMIVLQPTPWIKDVLSTRSQGLADPMFEMAFSIGGNPMFESPRFSTTNNSEWIRKFEVNNQNLNFVLSIRPTGLLVEDFETLPEDIAALLFFLLCALVSVILWLLGSAQEKLNAKQMSIDLLVAQTAEARKDLELKQSEDQSRKWLLDHLMADTRLSLDNLMQIVPHLDKDQFPHHLRDYVRTAKNSTFYLLSLISRINELNQRGQTLYMGDEEDFDLEQLVSSLITLFRPLSNRHNVALHYNIVGDTEQIYRGYAPALRQFLFEFLRETLNKREQGAFGLLVSVTDEDEGVYRLDLEFTYQAEEHLLQSNHGSPEIKFNETLLEVLDAKITEYQTQKDNLTLNVQLQVQTSDRKLPKVTLLGQDVEIPNMNILLVEDSDINQMIVKEMLVKDGHQVSVCGNGAQAVSEIKDHKNQFDLVLMDIQMPVMNGIDATIAIRAAGISAEKLPIIAMTANTLKSQVDKYFDAGMQKILTKPIIHTDVRNVFASLILDRKGQQGGDEAGTREASDLPLIDTDILEPISKLMTKAQLDILVKSLQETLNYNVPKLFDKKLSGERRSRFAHEIKGMAANAGLTSVAEIASRIEMKFLSGEDCNADIKSLQHIFGKSIRVLNEYLQLEKQKNTGTRTS